MTIAVGVLQGPPEPGVWLAADTLMCSGFVKHHIHKIEESCGVAFATSGYLLGQEIARRAVDKAMVPPATGLSMTDFVNALRSLYKEYAWESGPAGENGPAWWDQSFLMTDGSTLWHVSCELHCLKYEKYWAIGCGTEVALGSLFTSSDLYKDGERRARLAVEAACEYAKNCGGEPETVFVPRGKTVLVP